jgi:RNA polymerase sigma-70 factor (ECF subfamily)
MSSESFHTQQMQRCVEALQAGDVAAGDALIRAVCDRMERLASKMLRRFPNVQRWADTGDVLQESLLRLLRSLQKLQPPSMRDFYNLAAALIRRELLDLARHYARANRIELAARGAPGDDWTFRPEPASPDADTADLDRWTQFHIEWQKLPPDEREVVGLIYYHGRTQKEVAEILNISLRSVQRHWQAALLRLHSFLGEV